FVALGGEVVIAVRNQHSQDWLEHTFGKAIKEAMAEVCGPGTALKWAVDGETVDSEQSAGVSSKQAEPKAGPEPRLAATRSGARGVPEAERPAARPFPAHTTHHSSPQTDLFGDPVAPRKPKAKRVDPAAEALSQPVASPKTGRRWKHLHE